MMSTILELEKVISKWFIQASGITNCMWANRMGTVTENYGIFTHMNLNTLATIKDYDYAEKLLDTVLKSEMVVKLTVFGDTSYYDLVNLKASLSDYNYSSYLESNGCPVLRCGQVKPIVTGFHAEYLQQSEMLIYFDVNISWKNQKNVETIDIINIHGEIMETPNDHEDNIEIDISTDLQEQAN